MSDVGVNARKAGPCASVSERRETNERPVTVNVVRQWTSAVALKHTFTENT